MYKTWSLVSNFNSSKTFALASLENLKFRSSGISLQRSFSLKFIWVRKYFSSEKILVRKIFGSEKILVQKTIFGLKTILGLKNFIGLKKFWVWKKFWIRKKCWVKQILGAKNIFLGQKKNFGSKKISGKHRLCATIRFLVCAVIVDFGWVLLVVLVLCCNMGHSDPLPIKLSQKPMSSVCVEFQPSSKLPSDRFWWVVLFVLVVTGAKQSQLLV